MVLKVKHNELKDLMKEHYKHNISMFIVGGFGIGKSGMVEQTAEELAKSKGRKYVNWNKIDREEKQKVYEYPEKYFVLMDIRLSEMDETDIIGIPLLDSKNGYLEYKSPFWAKMVAKQNSSGLLFFDEINLASNLVQSSSYKVIYDRVIGNEKINDGWGIFSAGNRDGIDRGYTFTMAMPLRDRVSEVELINPSGEEWVEWAIKKEFDSRIIGYISFKESCLNVINLDDEQKQTTPRGWDRVNTLIKGRKIDNMFKLLCCSAIGEGVAREFISFCELQEKTDIEELIKNPKKLKSIIDISIKYLLLSVVAERYAKNNKTITFDKIIEISTELDKNKDAEFVALLWRFCLNYTRESNQFADEFRIFKDKDGLIKKYGKYLL
jgi:hypothetical protein